MKKGNRLYGAIYGWSSGAEVYLALRCRKEIFRSGEITVNSAEVKGIACWAIDESTLLDMRARKIDLIGIRCWDTNDIYLATATDWSGAKFLDYTSRKGSLQRYLPVNRMLVSLGKTTF